DLRSPLPEFREEEFAKLFEAAPAGDGETGRRGDGATKAADDGEIKEEAEETAEPSDRPVAPSPPRPVDPEPVEIQFEGLRDRLRFLTPISLHSTGLRISPDGKQLIYVAHI